jgi:heme iron utilization protein
MQGQFGQVVSLLRSLPDFHLFALCPESARYVAGFGQAYTVNVENGSVTPYNKKDA